MLFGKMRLANAIRSGDELTVKKLLERDATLATRLDPWKMFRSIRDEGAKAKIIDLILAHGGGRASADGARDVLRTAASSGSVEIIRMLLRHGVDVNAVNLNGSTPLHCAAGNYRAEAAAILLEHGANPNALDHKYKTPLDLALTASTRGGRTADKERTLNLLQEHGAKKGGPKTNEQKIRMMARGFELQAALVDQWRASAFKKPGHLYNRARRTIISDWLTNFSRNLREAVEALITGKDATGAGITMSEVRAGVGRMCEEYGRSDTMQRLLDVCGAETHMMFRASLLGVQSTLEETK
jgi:hypothetical protein